MSNRENPQKTRDSSQKRIDELSNLIIRAKEEEEEALNSLRHTTVDWVANYIKDDSLAHSIMYQIGNYKVQLDSMIKEGDNPESIQRKKEKLVGLTQEVLALEKAAMNNEAIDTKELREKNRVWIAALSPTDLIYLAQQYLGVGFLLVTFLDNQIEAERAKNESK